MEAIKESVDDFVDTIPQLCIRIDGIPRVASSLNAHAGVAVQARLMQAHAAFDTLTTPVQKAQLTGLYFGDKCHNLEII